jgi:hypothetical protein
MSLAKSLENMSFVPKRVDKVHENIYGLKKLETG